MIVSGLTIQRASIRRRHLAVLCLLSVCAMAGPLFGQSTADQVLRRFVDRIDRMEEPGRRELQPDHDATIPEGYQPWWSRDVRERVRPSPEVLPLNLEGLVLNSLAHSSRMRSLNGARLIALADLDDVKAAFDWRAFMESRYVDTSEPVGSVLTTGRPGRYRDHDWNYTAGMRQKNSLGGRFELSQRIGYRANNSSFLNPADQGSGRLAMSYSQPLTRGAGRNYNCRYIVLARGDAGTAEKEFVRLAQAHVFQLAQAYWQLYLARAVLLQKRRLHRQAREIYDELESRQEIDAIPTQVLQARAAVAKRRAEILRSAAGVENLEAQIRALVGDPRLARSSDLELIPHQSPGMKTDDVGMKQSLRQALLHRPEIYQAINDISAAHVRLAISSNELMPALDMILETYLSGLEGHSDLSRAYANQFSEGEPSYTLALQLELPLYNRAAKARHRRQQIELQVSMNDLATTVESVLTEVEVAVREVWTLRREMGYNYQALVAKQAEVAHLQARWALLPGDGNVASVLLEQLLESQEGTADAEFALASSLVEYDLALVALKRAEGTLLRIQSDLPWTGSCNEMPPLVLESRPGAVPIEVHARAPLPRAVPPSSRVVRLPKPD